jgi:N-acetylmuramoyl-L-alanine amidase
MGSTLSDWGPAQADGARQARRARRGMAGRLMGSLARTVSPSLDGEREARWARPMPDDEPMRRAREGAIEVEVGDGETVFDIAARHGVSTASLLALNGLGWRTQLRAGQTLLVKPPAVRPATTTVADELHRHRVSADETVSSIAQRHGVATAAVLLANGLSRGSTVRPGQQLVIPVPNLRKTGSGAIVLTGEMRDNAHTIIEVGRDLGLPSDGVVVALCAAMQDSSLHNLPFGEDDAVGLFQQRPSRGWGDDVALLDPRLATVAFYGGAGSGVVAPATGLLDVGGWEFMSVGEAAHAVQRNASPAAYGKWERAARGWLHDLERAGR